MSAVKFYAIPSRILTNINTKDPFAKVDAAIEQLENRWLDPRHQDPPSPADQTAGCSPSVFYGVFSKRELTGAVVSGPKVQGLEAYQMHEAEDNQ